VSSRRRTLALLLLPALLGACSGARAAGEAATPPPSVAAAAPTPTTTAPTTTAPPSTTTAPPTTTTAVPVRPVHEQPWTPMAAVGDVVLQHPSARVEHVAFHESNHDGAREMEPLPTAAAPITLESRERGTGTRSAVDVVIDPDVEVRAPVTGRVLRAGTYVLYCDNQDDYAVIEPDARPGWEVKVLHIDGVQVRAGDRVVAGETVLAPRPTRLPFESQVDEVTFQPAWPHVHIEVVDPSIPNTPKGGGC
jgi:biotin carboxyl carrier protein